MTKNVQGYVNLYKQQMEHFRDTQGVEWKANFGVWTLLAGSIYFVVQHPIHVRLCFASVICIGTVTMHFWWLSKIHHSQQFDKKLWVEYRKEALLLLRGGASPLKDENTSERNWWGTLSWLLVEIWLTIVLSAILLWALIACGQNLPSHLRNNGFQPALVSSKTSCQIARKSL
jgi:hypothetical protein